MKYEDNNFVAVMEELDKKLENLKFSNGEKQYISAGGALEAKRIIEEAAHEYYNPGLDRLQLGKYVDSSVEGHLGDLGGNNVSLQNLHGENGWNYQVGYINRTAKVIARFLNDGTFNQRGNKAIKPTHFFDHAIVETKISPVVLMRQRERALKLIEQKQKEVK